MNIRAIPSNVTYYASQCWQTVNKNKGNIAKVTAAAAVLTMLAYNHASKNDLREGLNKFEANYLENFQLAEGNYTWGTDFKDCFPPFSTKSANFDCTDGILYKFLMKLAYPSGCHGANECYTSANIHEKMEEVFNRATYDDSITFNSYQSYSEVNMTLLQYQIDYGDRSFRRVWPTEFVVCKRNIPMEFLRQTSTAITSYISTIINNGFGDK